MPDPWRVILLREPEKVMARLPNDLRQRLRLAIDRLETDPRPHGCKKLAGYENYYRVRVGDWRITYAIKDAQLIVLVIEVAPRGGAYRGLER
jgi:mRNA interferase RelE/StbE